MNLIDIIDDTLIRMNIEESAKHNSIGKFHPSAVGQCLRAIGYSMLGREALSPEPKGLRIMDNGTYMHDRTEKCLRNSGIVITSELPLKDPELLISGRLDVVIKNIKEHVSNKNIIKLVNPNNNQQIYEGPSNDLMIVEIKSINDGGFNPNQNTRYPKEFPKPENVDQIQLYMHMTGIHDGLLLYENKNDQQLKEVLVDYDPFRANKVLAKIGKAKYYYEKGTVAPRQYSRNDIHCSKWCDYRHICWKKEEDTEQDI